MSDDLKVDDANKDDKEARRKRKELRRQKREQYQNRLKAVDKTNPDERNPIIVEIITEHLKRDMNVFQARWQTGTVLSNKVFIDTPLFWYKKHKWSHKDVKEFFKIVGVYRDGLDSELNVIWGIDEHSKKRKKEQVQSSHSTTMPLCCEFVIHSVFLYISMINILNVTYIPNVQMSKCLINQTSTLSVHRIT